MPGGAPPLRNRSIPDATFIPVRSYPDLDAAVTWLRDVLGARERLRIPHHRVQLSIGNGAMVVAAWDAAAVPATGGRPPAVLMVRVPDVHAAYARAIALGATGLTPPADHPYGERQASVRDPAGHAWTLTQTIADVDPASWGGELVE
ncbi:glyoxalase [Gemmatimonas groenlandica]|uniref:Glyoxalase n=2 Tax=Gemmatimonas groenlandica TaxID=2732249 RepID=A0A6M4IZE7_9BACT|nr:glyoxalase [Gemmatimonas groenlandica]